ncbi:hypothetical protein F2Q69_00016629 [Brassica cretica]|uniref:RING-type E3 ubiquitin transferase n=1 Tax=Brassica cretica TaxID=69181 RepID=A0A8S9R6J9_BRACR|nr:hypothetical protein F2Q69_00016629 [Brassica cretica]
MWLAKNNSVGIKEGGSTGVVAVAIDKEKSSQHALKWAVDHLLQRGQSVILVHVKLRPSPLNNTSSLHASSAKLTQEPSLVCRDPEGASKDIFLPFRCFCTRKDIQCQDVLIEEYDVAKALVEYANQAAIEVEVLSSIRHPNMVLLLGACPECGCLVYEFMANGSLEDRLFRLGNSPPLSWQMRFRIAAEIGTGLLFLHQAKPEPLVHRDLKPGNILLDRNFVSKISDVGLARLVPPTVADTVTQYRMTSTAGTFCYIDPEYQQTGMLGVKSDIYSLGIMFLQLITAKPPMGLTHYVERALEKGTLSDLLDPAVTDWPVEDTAEFAKLALQCAELRRKDRPDLAKVILPELNRLRTLADESQLVSQ